MNPFLLGLLTGATCYAIAALACWVLREEERAEDQRLREEGWL